VILGLRCFRAFPFCRSPWLVGGVVALVWAPARPHAAHADTHRATFFWRRRAGRWRCASISTGIAALSKS
jgi:hypothetical protein